MSISKLPSGQWRAQVYNPATGKNESAAKILGLDAATFDTKGEAKTAREDARKKLREATGPSMTLRAWWEDWTTDPLWQRPKPGTNINNRESTRSFVDRYGSMPLAEIDHEIVKAWLKGGSNVHTIKFIRTMFSDAMSPDAGRLINSNPFAGLRISRGKGNAKKPPPAEDLVWKMIVAARSFQPNFAAWMQVACFTGMRHGELDGLRWANVDLDGGWINVVEQFDSKSQSFQLPKNGLARIVPLHEPARLALESLNTDREFVFVNRSGNHWTRSARDQHWHKVRGAVGWSDSLYLATRHFAGSWLYNDCGLRAPDVAAALGHEPPNGSLIESLYGHFRNEDALQRVKAAVAARNAMPGLREAA